MSARRRDRTADADGNVCPLCGVSLQGKPIPEDSRRFYGDQTHFQRVVGMEVQGVYDGVLFWVCPDCHGGWPRFTGDDRLAQASAEHVADHNRAVALLADEMTLTHLIEEHANAVRFALGMPGVGHWVGWQVDPKTGSRLLIGVDPSDEPPSSGWFARWSAAESLIGDLLDVPASLVSTKQMMLREIVEDMHSAPTGEATSI